jgi:hypothetical protein
LQQAVSERLSLSENKSFFWNFDDSCNRICTSLVAEIDTNLLRNSVFLQSGILSRDLIGLFLPRNMTYGSFFFLSPGAFLPAQALLEEIISVERKHKQWTHYFVIDLCTAICPACSAHHFDYLFQV